MGQKTNPIGFRLAVRRNWQSRWYSGKKDFAKLLLEDQIIREKLMEKLKQASVPRIFMERASNRVRVKIYTARPGIVIGRKGQEIEKIKEELSKLTGKDILLDIQEVKKPEIEAQLVAENVALQLERRIAFRRAMKKAVEMAMALGAAGAKVAMNYANNQARAEKTFSEFKAAGHAGALYRASAIDESDVNAMVNKIGQELGPVDIIPD